MSQIEGISLRKFAEQLGIRETRLREYCIAGKVIGARKHPLTKKWIIYPPAKLVLSRGYRAGGAA
jgi:hypothetical protein